ncbi:MAG: reverse transcriptase domain-containing protein [Sedimenticola sp.]
MPKKNGKLRPVLDLSALNRFVLIERFKMETTRSIRDAIRPGDWAVSIDLQDAYLHVPIRRASRKFLRFVSEGKAYQFTVLPFGLSTAPRVFTILMEVVAAAARRMGVSLLQYLDDWLLVNQSRTLLLRNLSTLWDLILSLGLIPNLEKSELIPSQNFKYVGMNFLTDQSILRLPEERIASTLAVVFEVLNATSRSARRLLSLLGTLSAAAGLLQLGRLHLRPLQVYLLFLWRPHVMPLEQMIPLSGLFKRHLRWWALERRYWEGVPMVVTPPSVFLTTDASQSGWGASLDPVGRLYQGIWSPEEVGLHINLLEMRAVYLALVQAAPLVSQRGVMISTDNTTVVSYLQKQGGTHSVSLCLQTREILMWCQSHGVTIQVRHIPGRLNALADALSRSSKPVLAEWSLERSVCRSILTRWGAPWVDLFATRLNNKLPLYVSPALDPAAWAVDAMSLSWNHLDGYAFPPFIMVPQVLAKVRQDGARLTLVAPCWPTRQWFSLLLELLTELPVLLPVFPRLLSQHGGQTLHSNVSMLNLHAWRLSGIPSERRAFQLTLPESFLNQTGLPLLSAMTQSGEPGLIGVIDRRWIYSIPL